MSNARIFASSVGEPRRIPTDVTVLAVDNRAGSVRIWHKPVFTERGTYGGRRIRDPTSEAGKQKKQKICLVSGRTHQMKRRLG
jgi:hypothetical protein